jgi:hypothetical protein
MTGTQLRAFRARRGHSRRRMVRWIEAAGWSPPTVGALRYWENQGDRWIPHLMHVSIVFAYAPWLRGERKAERDWERERQVEI